MTIRTEYQVVVTCDFCGNKLVKANGHHRGMITEARKLGWRVTYKQATCPKCRHRASAVFSERVKAGMNLARLQGKHIGRPKIAQKGYIER